MYLNSLYYEILSWLNNAIVLTLSLSNGCVPEWIHRSQWMNEWMNETESSVKPGVTEIEWTTIGFSPCCWCLLGQDINIKKKNAVAPLGWSRSKCRRHKYAFDCASCHKNAGQNHNIKWIWKIPSLKMWQNSNIVNSSDNAKLHLQRK